MPIGKPNPRGKKVEKQPGMASRFGSPMVYVLLLLVGFLLLRTLFQDAGFAPVDLGGLHDAGRLMQVGGGPQSGLHVVKLE